MTQPVVLSIGGNIEIGRGTAGRFVAATGRGAITRADLARSGSGPSSGIINSCIPTDVVDIEWRTRP